MVCSVVCPPHRNGQNSSMFGAAVDRTQTAPQIVGKLSPVQHIRPGKIAVFQRKVSKARGSRKFKVCDL